MRTGVRIGIDVGSVRVGVARTDPLGTLAIPLETVRRDQRGRDIARIVSLVKQIDAIEVVVGLPQHLKGVEGESAKQARKFASRLKRRLPKVRVCLIDERLTSTQAHLRLTEAGVKSQKQREIVDQVAAQIILDQAIEIERLSGQLPGITLADEKSELGLTTGEIVPDADERNSSE